MLNWCELWKAEVVPQFDVHVVEISTSLIIFWYYGLIHKHATLGYKGVVHYRTFMKLKEMPIEKLFVVYETPYVWNELLVLFIQKSIASHQLWVNVFVWVVVLHPLVVWFEFCVFV